MFQARIDSLIVEFKSVIAKLNKCALYPSVSKTGQALSDASADRDILPTIFFSDNYVGKKWIPYSRFSLSHQRGAWHWANREICKITSHAGICHGGNPLGKP